MTKVIPINLTIVCLVVTVSAIAFVFTTEYLLVDAYLKDMSEWNCLSGGFTDSDILTKIFNVSGGYCLPVQNYMIGWSGLTSIVCLGIFWLFNSIHGWIRIKYTGISENEIPKLEKVE